MQERIFRKRSWKDKILGKIDTNQLLDGYHQYKWQYSLIVIQVKYLSRKMFFQDLIINFIKKYEKIASKTGFTNIYIGQNKLYNWIIFTKNNCIVKQNLPKVVKSRFS